MINSGVHAHVVERGQRAGFDRLQDGGAELLDRRLPTRHAGHESVLGVFRATVGPLEGVVHRRPANEPQRHVVAVVVNAELRTPYLKGVGLVGFLDAGNVFLRASDLDVAELRASAGIGFRYRSPLGPLRFDIGFKLDRRDFNRGAERRAVYHLSLGQAF